MTEPSSDPLVYAAALALACRTYSALDRSDADVVVDCFADDATWHRPDGVKTGQDEIRAVVDGRPQDQTTAHCVSNLRVDEDEGSMVALYYLTVFGAGSGTPARLFSILDCRDELVTVPGRGLRIRAKSTRLRMKFGD